MKFLQNQKLTVKLPLAFAVALVLAVGAGLLGIYQLNRIVGTYVKLDHFDYANDRAVADMHIAFDRQVQEWKDTLLRGSDRELLGKHWGAFEQDERTVAEMARNLDAALPPGEARSLVEQFMQAHRQMGQSYRKAFSAFEAAHFDATAGDTAVRGIDRAPSDLLNQAREKIVAATQASIAQAQQSARYATIGTTLLLLIVLAGGVCAGVLFSRSIARPIARAVKAAEATAAGDLTSRIEITSSDEIGHLLAALKTMNNKLIQIVAEVRSGVDSVSTASSQIEVGNQDLSRRTEEQASSLAQTTASIEQLTNTVKQSADNAKQARQLAAAASAAAAKGGEVVAEVVTTMEQISEASSKIAEIINVIDSIAFQTNILALNAAVEAARAGQEGRGFAVVAGEVRNLAQRSAQAAREIKSMISDSVQKVETGSRLVRDAGASMGEIVSQVTRVTDLIGEITSAAIEQSTGIEQVNDAVLQMDRVTQQNAALVEQSAAAASSLKQQAVQLSATVAVFKLEAVPMRQPSPLTPAPATLAIKTDQPSSKTRPSPPLAATQAKGDDWQEF